MAKTHLEIERRRLLSGLPKREILTDPRTVFIFYSTIYIFVDENLEVRIQQRANHEDKGPRRSNPPDFKAKVTYPLVIKLGCGMIRQESPKLLANREIYDYYDRMSNLPRISVKLWEVPLPNNKVLEIKKPDRTRLPKKLWPQDLVLAELEFDTVEEANAFNVESAPAWFRELTPQEVTSNPRYNMRSLAVHGIPNPR